MQTIVKVCGRLHWITVPMSLPALHTCLMCARTFCIPSANHCTSALFQSVRRSLMHNLGVSLFSMLLWLIFLAAGVPRFTAELQVAELD